MSKLEAYNKGLYRFTIPPVCPMEWKEQDWINYIDSFNGWTVEVY